MKLDGPGLNPGRATIKTARKEIKMKATHIIWDVDYPEDLEGLPTEIEIPDSVDEEDVPDYLSDLTGFCHKGYVMEE